MKNAVRFKVYPEEGKPLFFMVYIFRSKQLMYDHFTRTNVHTKWQRGNPQNAPDFAAITQSYLRYDVNQTPPPLLPDMGRIFFFSDGHGAEIASHEMTHAALYWAQRKRIKATRIYREKEIEERFCLVQGELVRQFWHEFYRLKEEHDWLK